MSRVTANEGTSRTVSRDEALGQTVGDVMIRHPKTLPVDARVFDVRAAFERPTVRTVLLADGERFAGAIERDGLPTSAPADALARDYVEVEPLTVTPEVPMSDAINLLADRDEPRLIVLGEDGMTLLGLLCANAGATGFCVR
jgi:CBS domain-containing protein